MLALVSALTRRRAEVGLCLVVLVTAAVVGVAPQPWPARSQDGAAQPTVDAGLSATRLGADAVISDMTTNLGDYPDQRVPLYGRLEITFQVETGARNLQLPYDAAPPPGVEPGVGISVDALFTPDGWQTVYSQPAFYYQAFEHQTRSGKDWIYPTGEYCWMVRFTPTQAGEWQYRIRTRDSAGTSETGTFAFTVVPSQERGFVRVSERDPRYFEFGNGEHFLGLGYNLTFNSIDWDNPRVTNEPRFQKWQESGLQFFRFWMSQWGIYTSAWGAWNSPLPERHAQYIPAASLSVAEAYPGSDTSMVLSWDWEPGMFLGFMKQGPAVKRNTRYHISIRYLIPERLQGPRIAGRPYGLVAKTGGWLTGPGAWPEAVYGYTDPGTGTVVSRYATVSPTVGGTPQWSILEGEITTGEYDFLPFLYLVLENVGGTPGGTRAYIDLVEIREDYGGGNHGPNIVTSGWMAKHLYMDQRQSYAFDQVLDLAEQYDVYLKPVILEKNEWTLNRIDYGGSLVPDSPANNWFYGNWREMTKVRWLQQAWWRYLQARWGYSTHIHSWELLNEGDPWNGLHYTLADEFGEYMHQFTPNDHLVTTSFWHSFPRDTFWANADYPNIDFADVHKYEESGVDTTQSTYDLSTSYGALRPGGADKPLIRGETGFGSEVLADTGGVWLHNYVWALVNPGGMYEHYWYAKEHIEQPGNDLRYHYRAFSAFMDGIPLSNGRYQDAQATVSSPDLRAWGQKDVVVGRAHLWIQNRNHSWLNVVRGVAVAPASGMVSIAGLPAGDYTVQWWDTIAGAVVAIEGQTLAEGEVLRLTASSLADDVAVKVLPGVPPEPLTGAARSYVPLIGNER